jgi:hypothetical protein
MTTRLGESAHPVFAVPSQNLAAALWADINAWGNSPADASILARSSFARCVC